ncbi:hypothetical protein OCA8868_01829 [Octadecabacter ascidiaceicola]|uniref:Bacteriocin-protection, YdeI or OmpD-Associated n=2 Tax=Octadecabacter ascidiaceicola TaxID=1655543 RepID=A0A238K863_9RHOB|nr:hypothetical protein OCA8868_01829 [Octadecabacter ascidiaceicola]
MPAFVSAALDARNLRMVFDARPAYQQNDWIGWITAAKREDTKQRRLEKMLSELAAGHGYMGMEWQPKPCKED